MPLRPWASAAALLALTAAILPTRGNAGPASLDAWIGRELSPYVIAELSSYPLFKGAVLRFVVLDGDNPAARSNALALGIRDRLAADAVDTPGLVVAWRPEDPAAHRGAPQSGYDCTAAQADIYVGIEAQPLGMHGLRVAVRALDMQEQRWVSGFGLEWRGDLTIPEQRALQTPLADRSFLGDRGVPFEESELDMLAARLARDLGCNLMRQVSGDYVFPPTDTAASDTVGRITDLVGNNVASAGQLRFAATATEATVRLETSAHRIDADLYQYWVRAVPTGADPDLLPVSASAYGTMPPDVPATGEALASGAGIELAQHDLLDGIRIVHPAGGATCGGRNPGYASSGWRPEPASCVAIEVRTRADAVVFLLNHQPNHGLVRLDDGACRSRTAARVARAREPLRLELPGNVQADTWETQDSWSVNPDSETYYAVAVSDSRAARELASTLDRLPQRCTDSLRIGYEGRQLDRWLNEFARELARWPADVDWRALSVRDVY